ncbi:MAG TPA: hypothetical protein VJZ26_12185 [Blastocatellia bacterium]|nr:hypothetical protein [Blastocatellia bacterium]
MRSGVITGLTAAVPLTASKAFGQKVGGPSKGGPGDAGDSTFINTDILSYITPSVFEDHIGTSFLMRADALDTQSFELAQVRVRENSERLDTFSLLFTSPDGAHFPQASYLFEHEKVGVFPLFVVPVKTPKGMRYEAIFNRLRGFSTEGSK